MSSLKVGLREVTDEKVLLVCRSKVTGAERVDWWPSVEEAQRHDMEVIEVRERIKVPHRVMEPTGLWKLGEMILGRAISQEILVRRRSMDQKEFFKP